MLAARLGEAPDGGATLLARMRQLDFRADELAAAGEVLRAADQMQAIERAAFAATQGLYDRASDTFVDDGRPDMAYATALVHSPRYEGHRAALQAAVDRLVTMASRRTAGEVMRGRLDLWIGAAIAVDLALVPLMLATLVAVRRQVLVPIGRIVGTARRLGEGEFGARSGPDPGGVQEFRCCRGCSTRWPAPSSATWRAATSTAASCRPRATPPRRPPRPSRASRPT